MKRLIIRLFSLLFAAPFLASVPMKDTNTTKARREGDGCHEILAW